MTPIGVAKGSSNYTHFKSRNKLPALHYYKTSKPRSKLPQSQLQKSVQNDIRYVNLHLTEETQDFLQASKSPKALQNPLKGPSNPVKLKYSKSLSQIPQIKKTKVPKEPFTKNLREVGIGIRMSEEESRSEDIEDDVSKSSIEVVSKVMSKTEQAKSQTICVKIEDN